jgi:hypothetical protein
MSAARGAEVLVAKAGSAPKVWDATEGRPSQPAMQNAIVDLREALRERLAIIGDEESRRDEKKHMARLRAISEKIDRLQSALPRPIDPQLAHYLKRRSYDKALEFLEGRGD